DQCDSDDGYDQENCESYKGSGKRNPGNCSKCGSKRHSTADCPAIDQDEDNSSANAQEKLRDKSHRDKGRGKYRGMGKSNHDGDKVKAKASTVAKAKDDYDDEDNYEDGGWGMGNSGNWYHAEGTEAYDIEGVTRRTGFCRQAFFIDTQFEFLGRPEFLVRNIEKSENGHFPAGEMNLASYRMVRGRRRCGFLRDPGAATGIVDTDAVRECRRDANPSATVEARPTGSKLAGVDGKPTPGVGNAVLSLTIAVLNGATFAGDVIGDAGPFCLGIMPPRASVRYRAAVVANANQMAMAS
ncbi:unnamed protein product, partial [Prorocentrum cordatum]